MANLAARVLGVLLRSGHLLGGGFGLAGHLEGEIGVSMGERVEAREDKQDAWHAQCR